MGSFGSLNTFSYIMFCFILVQIAAISPADINYDETLSTLRYGRFRSQFNYFYL